jgi:hypothetical protein
MQGRADGCQLRSGRGSRTHTSSKNRSNAGRWPSNESGPISFQHLGTEGPHSATLKVGRGPGTESPASDDGTKAAVLWLRKLPQVAARSNGTDKTGVRRTSVGTSSGIGGIGCRLGLIACNLRLYDELDPTGEEAFCALA